MNFPGLPPLTGSSKPTPPNEGIHDGDKNGSFPQPEGGQQVHPTNYGMGGDRRGGTMPLGGSPSPITPPNRVFELGKS